ncbi:hypothetical protein CR513_31073, partial [Mucuna pruriens]
METEKGNGGTIVISALWLTPGLYPSYRNGRKSSNNHRESTRGRKYPFDNSPKPNVESRACRREYTHAFDDLEGCLRTRSHSNFCDTFQPTN